MLRFLCLALCIAYVSAGPIAFTNCGSDGTIHEVDVQGCTTLPCIFRKGQTYNIDTTLTLGSSGQYLQLEVKAAVSIITVEIIKADGQNGCPGLSSGCPHSAGTRVTHRTTMTISDQFIETDATVTLKLLTSSGRAEACIRAAARVTS